MSELWFEIKRMAGAVYNKLKAPEVVIPVVVTLIMVIAAELLVKNAFTVMRGDAVAIWDMAQVPIDPKMTWTWDGVPNSNVPYTYRILVPFIVRNFFHSSLGGFMTVAITSLLVSNYLVYKISQLYTGKAWVSFFLVITFSTNFTIFNPLVNPALVDMASFVTMLLLTLLFLKYIIAEKTRWITWGLFSVILLVSVLIKEWIFFVLPALFLYLLYLRKPGKAFLLVGYSLPAVATHLVIRLIMGPLLPELQTPSPVLLLERYISEIGAYRSLFATFGAIWLVIPFAFVYSYRYHTTMKETFILPVLAAIAGLFMMVIASDHNRYLFFMIFPFLIPALSLYFSKYNTHLRRGYVYAITVLFLISRLAMHFRPALQEAFAPTNGQSDAVLWLIATASIIQILVMLYYVLAVHRKIRLPGATF